MIKTEEEYKKILDAFAEQEYTTGEMFSIFWCGLACIIIENTKDENDLENCLNNFSELVKNKWKECQDNE